MNPSAQQTFSAFAIPLVLLGLNGVIKKLVRRSGSYRADDFYMGLDLTLAAFSLAVVTILELNPNDRNSLAWYTAFTFIMFILQLAFHQQWGGLSVTSLKQVILLGFAANAIGITLLGVFIYWKIEGKL